MSKRDNHYFIYPVDEKKKKTGHTICVILRDGMIFHGISLCSKKDNFSKKEGRLLAFDRAMKEYTEYLMKSKK